MVYYNEFDKFASQWLRNLIKAGHLPKGDVDDRPIQKVEPQDLEGYDQCHFFAGIGGWPLALSLAGWPDDKPVWTGSCPCQPFSQAGRRRGFADERHLFPIWRELIAKRKPTKIFGEQVASADGRLWLDRVRLDLEALGYAVGAADLCAAGFDAPHIRQRLYWVADGESERWKRGEAPAREDRRGFAENDSFDGRMANPIGIGRRGRSDGNKTGNDGEIQAKGRSGGERRIFEQRCGQDGITRRIEPGLSPLVDGFPGRVGRLRAYGNAIVPQVAVEFIMAFIDEEK